MAAKKPDTGRLDPGHVKLDVTFVAGPGKAKHFTVDDTGRREYGKGKKPTGERPVPGGGRAPTILPGEPGTRWVGKGDQPTGPRPDPRVGKKPSTR